MTPSLKQELEAISGWKVPEHDVLEWLLGKLPYDTRLRVLHDGLSLSWSNRATRMPHERVISTNHRSHDATSAALLLAIQLFKQNVLQRKDSNAQI